MNTLERPKRKRHSGILQMNGLLDVLCVPRVGAFEPCRKRNLSVRRRRGSWWHRNQHQLHELLYDLSMAYRRTIRRVHPDRAGGSEEAAVDVNNAWAKVKQLFAKRGITLN